MPEPTSLPRPTITRVSQNGVGSVRVDWTVENSDMDFVFDVCYSASGGNEVCPGNSSRLSKTTMSTTIIRLQADVMYTFNVYSVSGNNRERSTGMSLTVIRCSEGGTKEVCIHMYCVLRWEGGGGKREGEGGA